MEQLIKNVLIGGDYEVFLKQKDTNRIISAEGYILGTKEDPYPFDVNNPHFATSLDNVLAEYGIAPAKTKLEFYNNIQKGLAYIESILPNGLCTAILPSANLDYEFLQTEQAKVFGCEPDYNAYTGEVNMKPECDDPTLRSCGGHIHTSWDNPTNDMRFALIKMYDLHIGIPSVIMEPDNKRKELYGKAGACRPKEYGVEYRTPSNYYLVSKKLTEWVFNSAQNAIAWINEGRKIPEYMDTVIQNAINFNNKEMAAELMQEFKLKIAV